MHSQRAHHLKRTEEAQSADLQTRGCHCSCNSIGGIAAIPSISTEIQPQLWPVCQVLKGESIPSPGWVTGTARGICGSCSLQMYSI